MIDYPVVTVIIPCRNEGAAVITVLQDLSNQALSEPFEVIVADGSTDLKTTELLEQYQKNEQYPYKFSIIRNDEELIPHALNLMVKAARGKYIVRIDGHARLDRNYVGTILNALKEHEICVVGPQISYVPGNVTPTAELISAALNHKLGNGGTPSRNQLQAPRLVEHTVMSCYHRTVWDAVGGYDEALPSNEDFDFDFRAQQHGFPIYSLPEPIYRAVARATLKALVQQRWRYGFWKAQVLKKTPSSLKIRQLIPIAMLPLLIATAFAPIILLTLGILYTVVVWMALRTEILKPGGLRSVLIRAFLSVMVMFIIQIVWSTGVWYGIFRRNRTGMITSYQRGVYK